MSHEHELPQDEQIPEGKWAPDPRWMRFNQEVSSWSEPARDMVFAFSSVMLVEDIESRIRAHSENGDHERRGLINEFSKATLTNKQIRFVFRHYGLKVPKDGLKFRKSS